MIKIEHLNIGYKHPLLCQPFSIHITKPSLIALVGDNGVGKTSLLKTLAGLIPPLHGKITLFKQNIHSITAHHRAHLVSISLPYLPQHLNITVTEILNLTVNLSHANISSKYYNLICSQLQISNLTNQPFSKLSDGQKQKVMIARAFIQNTPIVLLDEPYSHLDNHNRSLLTNLFNSLKNKKIIIFTTHDQLSIFNVDLVWHIDNKKIIPQTVSNFLSNSYQIKQFYNFYHTHIVKTGKQY